MVRVSCLHVGDISVIYEWSSPPWRFVPWDEVRGLELHGFVWEPLLPTDILERSLLFCKECVTGKHLMALRKLKCCREVERRGGLPVLLCGSK